MGTGIKGDGCGLNPRTYICKNDGYKLVRGSSCGQRLCPDCWVRAAAIAAHRKAEKLVALRKLYGLPYGVRRMVLVLPIGEDPGDGPGGIPSWVRKRIKKVLKRIGVWAGVAVVHNIQIKEEYRREFNDEASRLNEEHPHGRRMNRYDILRNYVGGSKWENRDQYQEYYLHFHIDFYGRADADLLPAGWFMKVNPKPLNTEQQIGNAIFYQLSHALAEPGTRAIFEFGWMTKIRISREYPGAGTICCPICGQPLYDDQGNEASYTMKIREYEIRRKKPPPVLS